MTRWLAFAFLVLWYCVPAAAQVTLVTGTVTDLSGLPYAGATLKAQLVTTAGSPVTGQPTVTLSTQAQCTAAHAGTAPCQVPFQGTYGPQTLDQSGNIPGGGMNLQDNTLITPASTQWLISVTVNILGPPLGTGPQACIAQITISGAAQSVTPNFNSCPALSNGNLNSLNTTGVTLSQTCGKAVAPCIQIPAGGGCFGGSSGAVTNAGSNVITFASGFPTNPTPQVGQLAWVMLEHGTAGFLCGTAYNATLEITSPTYTETVYCGATLTNGGLPITITAVNPGVSITLSRNCGTTQPGTNAFFFYVPNIYSQMVTACLGPNNLGGTNVHVAQGVYGLDNTGNGSQSACGCVQLSGCVPNTYAFTSLSGESSSGTVIFTPPWYNHTGDLGTVLAGGILSNITFDGGWANLAVAIGRGTFFDGNACGSHDFIITGYNIAGAGGTSETLYPSNSLILGNGNCEIRNAYIVSGDSGIAMGTVSGTIVDSTVITKNPTFIQNSSGAITETYRILGGFYSTAGANRAGGNGGVIASPVGGVTPSGDRFIVRDADFCVTNGSNVPAINDTETSGRIDLFNVTLNSAPICVPGANVGGLTTASGIISNLHNTRITATGTGVPVTAPAGSTTNNLGGSSTSGGAANSIAGTFTAVPSESGTVTCAASAATITFKVLTYASNPIVVIQDRTTAGAVTQTSLSTTQEVVGCPGATDVLTYTVTPNPF